MEGPCALHVVEEEDEEEETRARVRVRVRVRAATRRGQRSVGKAKKCPRAVRLVSPRERGQGWGQLDSSPWSPGGLLSSTWVRIDNVYQDAVASTRATWDGEAAAWMGTIAAAMDEGGQKKRAIVRLGEAGGFYGCVDLWATRSRAGAAGS